MSRVGLSVVVLTYNRRELLQGCLESLFAQDGADTAIEIVVADDGSADGTDGLVRRLAASHPGLKYYSQPHRGIPAARNTGLRAASGRIVSFVADDYLLGPDYARTILDFFRERPQAHVVRFKIVPADDHFLSRVCHAYRAASFQRRLASDWAGAGRADLWRRLMAAEQVTADHGLEAAGGAAYRREVFDRVGLFDESLLRSEDSDFARRLHAAGIAVYYVPTHTIRHRYGRNLGAVLETAFQSGRFRRRYHGRGAGRTGGSPGRLGPRLIEKIAALGWAFEQALREGSLGRFFVYAPFLALIETVTMAGHLAEGVRTRSGPGRFS
jgi:GT2 family glycosyltransferase